MRKLHEAINCKAKRKANKLHGNETCQTLEM